MKIEIPWQCQEILSRLAARGLRAYLVGGCVRDSLLGRTPQDWDICTEAKPWEVQEIFRRERVILTGLQHGTVTVLLGELPVEVTTYRVDGPYADHRHPSEVFFTGSLREDLSRRDFTINALAYHPDEGVVDYFHGLEDLRDGIVRAVGDADSRYREDGLRMLRAVRFACVLGFALERGTRDAIRRHSSLLRLIARERIQTELDKILLSADAARGLTLLAELDCFPYFLPEICHTWQFAQRGGSHQYDVFTHTVLSVAYAPPERALRLTMLLHDIGKPFVWREDADGVDHFDGHGETGAALAAAILERLRYDKKTIARVRRLIAWHGVRLEADPVSLRRAASALGFDGLRDLLAVKRADVRAHSEAMAALPCTPFDEMERLAAEIEARGDCCSLRQLAVSGRDLTELGYRGEAVGRELARLLDLVLEEPSRNARACLVEQAKEDLA